jgi:hypothetical protein
VFREYKPEIEVKGRAGDFWSTYGQRQGIVREPMEGKDVWRS